MLLAPNHPQLHGGLQIGVACEVGRDPGCGHQRFEASAGVIVAHHAEQAYLSAQRGDVVRHIGSTPAAFFFARDAHHRHRRFRRDTVNRTEPVAVQHHVADDQHAGGRDAGGRGQGGGVWRHSGVHSSSMRRVG